MKWLFLIGFVLLGTGMVYGATNLKNATVYNATIYGTDPTVENFLLLDDGSSFLVLDDGTSKLKLAL